MKTTKSKLPKAQFGIITKAAKAGKVASNIKKVKTAAEGVKSLKDWHKINTASKATKAAKNAESLRHAKQLGKWVGTGTVIGSGGAYGLKKYAESEKAKAYKKPVSQNKSKSKKG